MRTPQFDDGRPTRPWNHVPGGEQSEILEKVAGDFSSENLKRVATSHGVDPDQVIRALSNSFFDDAFAAFKPSNAAPVEPYIARVKQENIYELEGDTALVEQPMLTRGMRALLGSKAMSGASYQIVEVGGEQCLLATKISPEGRPLHTLYSGAAQLLAIKPTPPGYENYPSMSFVGEPGMQSLKVELVGTYSTSLQRRLTPLYAQMPPGFAADLDRALGSFRDDPLLAVVSYGKIRNLARQLLVTYGASLTPTQHHALSAFERDMAEKAVSWSFTDAPLKPFTIEDRAKFLSLERPELS